MKITKFKDKIVVDDPSDFSVFQTLSCGQIFRYSVDGDSAKVYSRDKRAVLNFTPNRVEILTPDVEYFYHFFDFETDYAKIKQQLKTDELLLPAIEFAPGIRLINNDAFEILISFIISANNNIERIKKSIEYLCTHFGTNMGEYFAFPTLEQLKTATVDDFVKAGLGYRSTQMYSTVQSLTPEFIENLKQAPNDKKFEMLLSLKGVGEKVANCVMLFGLNVKNVFPVDTWINKVYNSIFNTHETDRKVIGQKLTARYNQLSGYAQQYFFYYYRANKLG